MPLHVRAALRRFVADLLSSRKTALFMILTLACWPGEGFAQKVLSVTPAHCKYKISPNPEAAGPGWGQPGFDDSGWPGSLPAADSYLPPGPYQWTRCQLDLRASRADGAGVRAGRAVFRVATFRGWHRSGLLRQPGDGPIFHESRATVSASPIEFRARRSISRIARNPAGIASPPLRGHGRTDKRWIATDADRPNLPCSSGRVCPSTGPIHLLWVFRNWRYIPAHFVQRRSQQEGSLLAGYACFRHPGPEDQRVGPGALDAVSALATVGVPLGWAVAVRSLRILLLFTDRAQSTPVLPDRCGSDAHPDCTSGTFLCMGAAHGSGALVVELLVTVDAHCGGSAWVYFKYLTGRGVLAGLEDTACLTADLLGEHDLGNWRNGKRSGTFAVV